MRTTPILALALLATAASAAAEAPLVLFEDARGDVGPWPTMIVGQGLPAPAWADLLGAEAAPLADGGLRVTIEVADVPASLPPDVIWAAGWKETDSDRYVAVGFVNLVVPGHGAEPIRGGAVCVFESSGEHGPEGEPECEDAPAAFEPGAPGRFTVDVPAELVAGGLVEPGGATILAADATAWPLFVLHLTGGTVLDFAWSEETVAVAAPEAGLAAASAAEAAAPREAPAAPLALALAGLAAAAVALRRT